MSAYLTLCPLAGDASLLLPDNILIPPPQEPARSLHPLRSIGYIIYGSIIYILHNGCLPPLNLILHWPQNHRLQGLLNQVSLPSPLPDSLSCHMGNPPKQLYGGTHPAPSVFHPSLPNSLFRIVTPYLPPTFTSLPMPAQSCLHSHACLHQHLCRHTPLQLRLHQNEVQIRPVEVVKNDNADEVWEGGC